MKKVVDTTRRGTRIAVCAALLLAMPAATNVRVSLAEEIDSVVASVDGDPITSHDLKNPSAITNGPTSPMSMGAPDKPAGALKIRHRTKVTRRGIAQIRIQGQR